MARNRRAGEAPDLPTRGPTESALGLLLRARSFRAAAGAERVAANLAVGGVPLSAQAAAWIGAGEPPPDAPSLSLGAAPGTLGPRSFGFLRNGPSPVAALDLPPLAALPRLGRLGLVVPTRAALPDLLPLVVARGLTVSWIISVGDGDPADAIAFLSADDATDALAVGLGAGARPAGLRAVLGAKPTVVFGGDAVCRAIARRAGAHAVDRIGEWLAHAALLGAGLPEDEPIELWAVGGGHEWVGAEARRYGLDAPVRAIDDRAPGALAAALAETTPPRAVVVIGAAIEVEAPPGIRVVIADTRQPEQASRLLKALGGELERRRVSDDTSAPPPAVIDTELVARVRAETDGALSDHDAKRLLKAWGARVTRQGPTGTPTGAIKLARHLDLPVVLVRGDEERVANNLPEVRRLAGLLLELPGEAPPSVMVREAFLDGSRARVRVTHERGVGLLMRVGEAVALLPLDVAEALRLAQQSGARRANDHRAVAGLLGQIAAAAVGETATLELEILVGADPVVLRASGALRRPPV